MAIVEFGSGARLTPSTQPRTARTEPCFDIIPAIPDGRADFEILRTRAKQPPTAHAGNAQLEELGDLVFVEQFRRGVRGRHYRGRVDRQSFVGGGLRDRLFSDLAILNFQFSISEAQPFDLFHGKQVDFT